MIQFVKHDARLNARPFLLAVDFENSIETRHVQNDARSDGRPGEIGTRGPRGQRDSPVYGILHDSINIVFTFREHHGLGRHPIHTRVDGVRS